MRTLALIPLFVLGACTAEAQSDSVEAELSEPSTLTAGEWETTTTVTQFASTDKAQPKITAAAGMTSSAKSCVAEGEVAKPGPALLTGNGDTCQYKNFYMARGRLNASLSCTRPGLDGTLMMTVEGTYNDTGLEVTTRTETYLAGAGNVRIGHKVVGRRIGDCSADTAA